MPASRNDPGGAANAASAVAQKACRLKADDSAEPKLKAIYSAYRELCGETDNLHLIMLIKRASNLDSDALQRHWGRRRDRVDTRVGL